MRWRSALFIPGNATDRIRKAGTRGADAIILDLEDGVAPSAKPEARAALPDHIAELAAEHLPVAVRINADWHSVFADLGAAVQPGLSAIMVPKAEVPARLSVVAEMLGELEAQRGLESGTIGLVALIESPLGLARAAKLAAAPRVIGLALGTEDFSLALGVAPTPRALALPVQQLSLAAAERGIMALAAPISIAAIDDTAGWQSATAEARAVGATGALCIHPRQVAIANTAFAHPPREIEEAQEIIAAWAENDGDRAGVIRLAGRMIDLPVVERARRILRLAQSGGVAPS